MRYISKTSRLQVLVVPLFLVSLLAATPSVSGIFVHIPNVPGDATVNGVPGQIEILSWSWRVTLEAIGSANGGVWKTLNMVLPTTRATPKILENFSAGRIIEEVTLTNVIDSLASDPGGSRHLIIRMKPVSIATYQTGGSSGDIVPTDRVSLNFTNIEFEYREIMGDGSVKFSVSGECEKPAQSSP
jgi:type VI secretion system secreted protein Hcp